MSESKPPQDSHSPNMSDLEIESAGRVASVEAQKSEAEGPRTSTLIHRLGWKRLTVVLIVEAIALGSLSIPQAFAMLGMVAGTISCVALGLVAIYTSYIVGQVKIKFPEVSHYADAGRLLGGGRWGGRLDRIFYEVVGFMFACQLTFLVGSHALTGTIALAHLSNGSICSVVLGFISSVILLGLAIPPTFTELAILGYIDFVSIILAIGITIIVTGVNANNSAGGLSSVNWSAWPKENLTFSEGFNAISNIVFAYSFSICQFSFMDEMHTPKEYVKSIWALGLIEIVIYTLTGALIYAFVGPEVQSPALLSAGALWTKVAFGVGLPVIFISGSINTTVVGRYIFTRMYPDKADQQIKSKKSWALWLALITAITVVAFIIAESIPFFGDLLALSSALFISGFTFYFPAWMWFQLIREGHWASRQNIVKSISNALIFLLGMVVLVAGTTAAIESIHLKFTTGGLSRPFTCTNVI